MRVLSLLTLILISIHVFAQNTSPYWSLAGNSTATSSAKLGTTNAIPLRLFTNNLERMRIDAATGKISIGSTAVKARLTLFNNGSVPAASWVTIANPLFAGFGETTGGNSDFFLLMVSNSNTTRPNVIGRRARGTLALPTAVVNNDYITSLQASGYDGSAFQNAANVDFFVDGVPSSGYVPMRISFSTGANLYDRKERLKIGSTGDINFNGGQLLLQQNTGYLGVGKIPSYNLDVLGKAKFSDKAIVGVDMSDIMNAGVEILSNYNGEGAYYIKDYSNTEYRAGFSVNGAGNAVVATYVPGKNIEFYAGGTYRMVLQSNGHLGIGISKPAHPLHVVAAAEQATIKGENLSLDNMDRFGVDGYSVNGSGYGIGIRGIGGWKGVEGVSDAGDYTGTVYGTVGKAYGTDGYRYGIYGTAINTVKSSMGRMYGIYGYAEGGSFNAAGFFSGDVYASSYITISDRKLKSQIKPMEHALDGLMKLKPATYTFKTAEFKNMNLPKGQHMGLIADELKEIFPELVKESIHPAQMDKDGRTVISPEVKYEGVNYLELIPILVASIQELKQENEFQKQELQKLNQMLINFPGRLQVSSVEGMHLGLVTPNPAHSAATIPYHLPEGTRSAYISIADMKGTVVKQVNLTLQKSGQVQLNTNALAVGNYTYSLIVNGAKVETRHLLIAR